MASLHFLPTLSRRETAEQTAPGRKERFPVTSFLGSSSEPLLFLPILSQKSLVNEE